MARLLEAGLSWSGHERHCAFLNLGDGTFANISSVSGFDFEEDGRAVALVDWDGDGGLDCWLRSRTGPQLRLLRNARLEGLHFLALKLEGRTGNRDAVGARVDVEAGGRRLRREVRLGSGYLSQSSTWLHFGLGSAARIDRLRVRWPGGEIQEVAELAADRRYHLVQGGEAVALPPRDIRLPVSPAMPPQPLSGARIVLRMPFPLPPSLMAELLPGGPRDRALLLNLWGRECPPCLQELAAMATASEKLRAAGIDLLALNSDGPAERDQAAAALASVWPGEGPPPGFSWMPVGPETVGVLDAVLQHVRHLRQPLPLPTSFLLDQSLTLQVIYLGPADPEVVAADAAAYGRQADKTGPRGPFPGRWYYGMPRDLAGLALEMSRLGRAADARYYQALDRALRRGLRDRR